jgi:hypothetical protein
MSWLTRPEVKGCIEKALRKVADFPGDIEAYNIMELSNKHQVVFMNAIADELKAEGFEITLSQSKLQGFPNMGALIDYVKEKQAMLP